jgi:hypothetical protein
MDSTAVQFDNGTAGTFIRTGECCRCGECCVDGDPFGGTMGEPEIQGACFLLKLLPDGLHACKDRENPLYLNGCNVWPSHPAQIVDKPSCTYSFEQVK